MHLVKWPQLQQGVTDSVVVFEPEVEEHEGGLSSVIWRHVAPSVQQRWLRER